MFLIDKSVVLVHLNIYMQSVLYECSQDILDCDF